MTEGIKPLMFQRYSRKNTIPKLRQLSFAQPIPKRTERSPGYNGPMAPVKPGLYAKKDISVSIL